MFAVFTPGSFWEKRESVELFPPSVQYTVGHLKKSSTKLKDKLNVKEKNFFSLHFNVEKEIFFGLFCII